MTRVSISAEALGDFAIRANHEALRAPRQSSETGLRSQVQQAKAAVASQFGRRNAEYKTVSGIPLLITILLALRVATTYPEDIFITWAVFVLGEGSPATGAFCSGARRFVSEIASGRLPQSGAMPSKSTTAGRLSARRLLSLAGEVPFSLT